MAKRNVTDFSEADRAVGGHWNPEDCIHAIVSRGKKVEMAAGVSWRHEDADPMVDVKVCVYCNTYMSLGEATNTLEASTELRAIAIVIENPEITPEEGLGIVECMSDIDTFVSHYTPMHWAGWLAARIIEHENPSEPEPHT